MVPCSGCFSADVLWGLQMRTVFLLMFLSILPASALGQRVDCMVFTPATVEKMNSHNIQRATAITEYMTAVELSAAMNRALNCEIPQSQAVNELNTAIAWHVMKFAQSSEQLNSMLQEYMQDFAKAANAPIQFLVEINDRVFAPNMLLKCLPSDEFPTLSD
jgi:uncharacterized coiled-coil protein SlyX